ncbi:hypothetical protein MUG78_17580 [Gordonia alkaliphila]|uniref:hypothetical protein n=1 Tax=Gordonia alkaliphila TaxID=1053547 RepID=UPI001FF53CFE|nr:hypothetical protein [Gordonia alkaliphila]MCK0441213.1 hypothetical protein [Gordonia alkaliphila]
MSDSWQAEFWPQAWQNNNAIDVDPEGPTQWPISAGDARDWLPEACSSSPDLDDLRQHPDAPQWVKDWRGPFYITLTAPDGTTVDTSYDIAAAMSEPTESAVTIPRGR